MDETAIRKIVVEAIKEHCATEHQSIKLIPENLLTKFTDSDWNSLWENGGLKPFLALRKRIQKMPGMKVVYQFPTLLLWL